MTNALRVPQKEKRAERKVTLPQTATDKSRVTVERRGKVLVIPPPDVLRGDVICNRYTQQPLRNHHL